jgi:hypothetical protein
LLVIASFDLWRQQYASVITERDALRTERDNFKREVIEL